MNAVLEIGREIGSLSDAARQRLLGVPGEPLFHCEWNRAVFIHYEVDAVALQNELPFPLDLRDGKAYVSLVAFAMREMRPYIGGRWSAALLKPIATHNFLNVRTYVKYGGETGIYFLAEWLPNSLSVLLGPALFGLPYRRGALDYRHEPERRELQGIVTTSKRLPRLEYAAEIDPRATYQPCQAGSLDEFLIERYTAFTAKGSRQRKFRVWHPPWPQTPVDLVVEDSSLLTDSWPWFANARLIGANFSLGFGEVWMGRPQKCVH